MDINNIKQNNRNKRTKGISRKCYQFKRMKKIIKVMKIVIKLHKIYIKQKNALFFFSKYGISPSFT